MNNLCFIIEGKVVYLEKILVEYDHIPVFMIGKDEKDYYLILCPEIKNLHYIIVKTTVINLYNMLNGKIPMRDLFLSEKKYWDLFTGENIQSDIIKENNIEYLNDDYLPKKGAYYKVIDEDIILYKENLLK